MRDKERDREHELSTSSDALIRTKTKRRESDQRREKERFFFICDVIKTFTLDQPTIDSTLVLKTGNRQTDRQTKAFLPV